MNTDRSMLERWGRFVYRKCWYVLGVWVVVGAALGLTARTISEGTINTLTLPGAESQQAVDELKSSFPERSGDYADVVFSAPGGIDETAARAAIEALAEAAAAIPGVVAVSSPFAPAGGLVSEDRTVAIARVQYAQGADDVPSEHAEALETLVEEARSTSLAVELGGPVAAAQEREGPNESTVLGIIAALVILYILFRAFTPTVLPIASAMSGLAIGFAVIYSMTAAIDLSKFAPNIAAMLGLGVGIDYSLFIVARFRENVFSGHDGEEAAGIAVATAGKSVAFAGGVVIVSLLGLGLMGIPFVGWLGLAAAAMVTVAVLAALSLLPALLGVTGGAIVRAGNRRRAEARPSQEDSGWYRLGHAIMRRPYVFLAASSVILLVLSIPFFDMRLGSADAGNNPTSATTRRAYDYIADAFGPGMNGPLQVVLSGVSAEGAEEIRASIAATPNVASVSPPIVNPSGDVAVLSVVPATSPQSAETSTLVHALRDDVLPAATKGTAIETFVGGATARGIDIADRIGSRLPLFFGLVIGISFLLLVVVFRSLMIPIKAALMNLLSIGAAYGVVVAVFQWGWGGSLVGAGSTGPIESFLPIMLFAVLFGLSMDYEVFLVSRIHEEYLRTRDNARSVARGLASTASVITAAAAIMIVVFLSFVLNDQRVVKEFGLGLAVAVFVDATVVRLLLVPATMELMGEWNWWLPRWLERIVPRISLEEGDSPASPGESAQEIHVR
ncbi:MAG: MMPL family transporter [Dehalococcoidia bacterium]|nr:MMPL family transporter [Dehalococcoidia bacterium]